jgi:phosphocarrier protein FPr
MARLDRAAVLGIGLEGGGRGHAAILARASGIPLVAGLGSPIWQIGVGDMIALDANRGRLWPAPGEAELAELRAERDEWLARQQAVKAASCRPAITLDGRRIEVGANIGRPADSALALEYGAEGVGLFRTEFLFLDRASAPDEAEQLEAYQAVTAAMGDRPVIIRTLDVGGDKPLPYLDLGREENPFLGWRGIRFCLERPDILMPQLRAILRAGAAGNVKIMFPMVSSLAELRAARRMLVAAEQELKQAGLAFDEQMEVGIMIEVPSAVAIADQLAAEVDFFSIGTNDLTQYTMAADRTNARVAGLADPLQPAVLRLVQRTAAAGRAAGIWVGICGELAGDPLAVPLLVGMGLTELSMNASSIPAAKQAIARIAAAEVERDAATFLALESAEAVRDLLRRYCPA